MLLTTVATALCTHTACFICRKKSCTLHKVKQKDIVHAYVHYRILIKSHARVCGDHLNEIGLIKIDEFLDIPTKEKQIPKETLNMFDLLSERRNLNIGIFEQFKDMKYLEDKHCKRITGWSKKEFTLFSEYITSIYNTDNRTKEQLIALYRYWLRTGIDQTSLASLFSMRTTQQQISDFLNQIRSAIHSDFTPFFLGANKNREFFLKFNTKMVQVLHNLSNDDLVIIADGTYCKIEKSKNNDFQYHTYSVQKTASLFKPFILCCADGYIIDCYGPFQATKNDSTILNYILETDKDLNKLLVPKKTLMLLDRGNFFFLVSNNE